MASGRLAERLATGRQRVILGDGPLPVEGEEPVWEVLVEPHGPQEDRVGLESEYPLYVLRAGEGKHLGDASDREPVFAAVGTGDARQVDVRGSHPDLLALAEIDPEGMAATLHVDPEPDRRPGTTWSGSPRGRGIASSASATLGPDPSRSEHCRRELRLPTWAQHKRGVRWIAGWSRLLQGYTCRLEVMSLPRSTPAGGGLQKPDRAVDCEGRDQSPM